MAAFAGDIGQVTLAQASRSVLWWMGCTRAMWDVAVVPESAQRQEPLLA